MQYIEVNYNDIKADGNVSFDFSAEKLVQLLEKRGWKAATAESCTGGLLADAIVSVAGASLIFDGGVVSYANRIKQSLLGVAQDTISLFGAVSPQCAAEMAQGIRACMDAQLGIASTGIAGPGGGSAEKPVGLVYIGVALPEKTTVFRLRLSGNRGQIRRESVRIALEMAIRVIENSDV